LQDEEESDKSEKQIRIAHRSVTPTNFPKQKFEITDRHSAVTSHSNNLISKDDSKPEENKCCISKL
jgi:hypothetical protein